MKIRKEMREGERLAMHSTIDEISKCQTKLPWRLLNEQGADSHYISIRII